MRRVLISALFLFVSVPSSVWGQAQSEADRLREALRGATIQLRSLEDQRAQLQAKLTESDREKQRANELTEQLKQQLKEAQDSLQQAVQEFNQRLSERDDTLEKWKTAYNQAADVARDKDAERAKFQSETMTLNARVKVCETRNAKLLGISNELLAAYRDLGPIDGILQKEPLIGGGRIGHQNRVQEFRDCILDQDVKIPGAAGDQKPQDQNAPQSQSSQGQQAEAPKSQSRDNRKPQNGSGTARQVKKRNNAAPAENQDKVNP